MKVCIAYESKYGNGKKCVEHLQSVISGKGHDVEIFSIRDTKPDSLAQAELYIFSSPTHAHSIPGKMKKFLRKLEMGAKGSKYAIMTTYVGQTRSLQKMEKILLPKGMTKVSDGLEIRVLGMKGPLEDGYKQKLEEFTTQIFG